MQLPIAARIASTLAPWAVLTVGLLAFDHADIAVVNGLRGSSQRERSERTREAAAQLVRHAAARDAGRSRRLAVALDELRTAATSTTSTGSVFGMYRRLRSDLAEPQDFAALGAALGIAGLSHDAGVLARAAERFREADTQGRQLLILGVALSRQAGAEDARGVESTVRGIEQLRQALAADARAEHDELATVARRLSDLLGWYRLVWTVVFASVGIVVTVRLARYLQAAVKRLAVAVEEVATGNYAHRVEVPAVDDLGAVMKAFNRMTETFRESDRQARHKEQELSKALRDLENIMETIPDIICILDLRGALDLWNRNLETSTGLGGEALKGVRLFELFVADDQPIIESAIRQAFRTGHFEVEGSLKGPDGRVVMYHWTGAVLEDEHSHLLGLTVSGRDISERKALEHQLAHQAFHDPLTKLPNRTLFMDRLQHAVNRLERDGRHFAVLFVDLDRFKVINDSLGHDVGDCLLIEVASRLQHCMRLGDTVARLGGDEFGILLEAISTPVEANFVADRVAAALEHPLLLDGRQVFITASIGIAMSDSAGFRPETILRDADMAMYRAKSNGKARCEIFDAAMRERAIAQLELEIDLRGALGRNELVLYYQPIVDLATGRVTELEALLRWRHPSRGLLPPGDFVTLAEETGLVVPIGKWVLLEACRQVKEWQRIFPALQVSVNLSGRQLQETSLYDHVADALRQSALDPASLKLEITESVLMADASATLEKLRALKELGVELAIDDFGTGYSSFSYLNRFPVNTLKIDRSFIHALAAGSDSAAIVRAIVTLANSLNLTVTAEGIETEAQLQELAALACQRGQGYYFASPLAPETLTELMERAAAEQQASADPLRSPGGVSTALVVTSAAAFARS